MSQIELKDVILDLFNQMRYLNARLAEKDSMAAEKDRLNASLTEKLDAVLENQKQKKLDFDS